MSTICKDNDLLVINNLKTESKHFVSGKTYKKKDVWLSELDVVVASRQLVYDIVDFQVHQTAHLPSDDAPVSLEMRLPGVNLFVQCQRASMLGGRGSPLGGGRGGGVRRPVGFNSINHGLFMNGIPASDMLYDINIFNINITNALYKCAKDSCGGSVREEDDNCVNRWEKLLSEGDHKRVWQAINWKGNLQTCDKSQVTPSDEQFREYFQNSFNVADDNFDERDLVNTEVNIPLLDDPITPQEVAVQVSRS